MGYDFKATKGSKAKVIIRDYKTSEVIVDRVFDIEPDKEYSYEIYSLDGELHWR